MAVASRAGANMSQHNLCPAGNHSQAPTTPTNKTCFSLQLPITAQGHNQRTTSRCPPHTPRGIVTSCPSIMAFSLQRAELGSIMLQLLGYHYLAVPHEDHSVHPYILRHTAVSGEKKNTSWAAAAQACPMATPNHSN